MALLFLGGSTFVEVATATAQTSPGTSDASAATTPPTAPAAATQADLALATCAQALEPLQRQVRFKRWSAEPEDEAIFQRIAAALMVACRGRRIVVEDRSLAPVPSKEVEARLMTLTQERAEAVKTRLTALGVPERQIVPYPRGRGFAARLEPTQRESEVLFVPTDQLLD